MKTKKQMSMKEYMNLQVRFILFVSQTNKIDNLTAAEIYAPLLAQKIRTKYEVMF
jgi:hypothetical protein